MEPQPPSSKRILLELLEEELARRHSLDGYGWWEMAHQNLPVQHAEAAEKKKGTRPKRCFFKTTAHAASHDNRQKLTTLDIMEDAAFELKPTGATIPIG
jgi:hypothetical protein